MKRKAYRVKLGIKSTVKGMVYSPNYTIGIVLSSSGKEAGEYAVNTLQGFLDNKGENAEVTLKDIKPLPSSFILCD
ncbi:hypothetical protein MWN41_11835 [Ornithobacterium rhinotracheale]|uniref:hypothetical protein n=1 Tax=Ornithobacterium rhinotracheale TaxID=28251 RepID=UPI001FF2F06D|nr:hypothetical protein [Ornithobacterium rhinotracheale]MCK0203705.1 hypothetical protein [Ornithobacterium rhinotracheale]